MDDLEQQHLLVILADDIDQADVAVSLGQYVPAGLSVRVIASPEISWLQWLTNDDDSSRRRAEELSAQVASTLDRVTAIEHGVGDPDPVQLADDAAILGPAHAVLVVFRNGASAPDHRERVLGTIAEHLGVDVHGVSLPC